MRTHDFKATSPGLALVALVCALGAACASAGTPVPGGPVPGAVRATPEQLGAVPGIAGRRIVGYFFGGTVLRGAKVADIRADRMTHLIYAFADIGPDGLARLENPCVDIGQCEAGRPNPYPQGGVFEQLRQLRSRYPHLKVLVSFGGWGRSTHFSDAAATPATRAAFIDSAVELLLRRYPGVFDGFDLDWEFPVRGGLPTNSYRPDDRANYTALVEELRARLEREGAADGKHYLLTIAAPAGRGHMANQDLARMAASLDFLNVMNYDYHSGGRTAHFNAPLFSPEGDLTPEYNVDWTSRSYLALGIPSYKIVVGVPFYGVSYYPVPAVNHGLMQQVRRETTPPATPGPTPTPAAAPSPSPSPNPSPTPSPVVAVAPSAAAPSPSPSPAPRPDSARPWGASFRYHLLSEAKRRGFQEHREPRARVPWLYHPESGLFVSYDDPRSLREKGDYVRRYDLGGMMIWEVSQDVSGKLLEAVWKSMR